VVSRIRRTAAAQIIVVVSGVYKATFDSEQGPQKVRAEAGDVVFWPAGSEDPDESEPGRLAPNHPSADYSLVILILKKHWDRIKIHWISGL
jgi:hypothetical protein